MLKRRRREIFCEFYRVLPTTSRMHATFEFWELEKMTELLKFKAKVHISRKKKKNVGYSQKSAPCDVISGLAAWLLHSLTSTSAGLSAETRQKTVVFFVLDLVDLRRLVVTCIIHVPSPFLQMNILNAIL